MATLYVGLAELEDHFVPLPPAIVEVLPKYHSSPVLAPAARVPPSSTPSAIPDDATSAALSAMAAAFASTSASAIPSAGAEADTASTVDSESESDDQSHPSSAKPLEKGEDCDVTAAQYFTSAQPSTARHRWLVLF